jgi:hypothetical protein
MKRTKLTVTLTTSALLAAQAAVRAQPAEPRPTPTATVPASAAEIAVTGKDALKAQLGQATRTEAAVLADDEIVMLTCYFTVSPLERLDFVCPVCGERTTLGGEENTKLIAEIDLCRRLFAQIPASAGMKLDETEYCRKCSPLVKSPAPILMVPTASGKVRRVRRVTSDELRQLGDYFEASPAVQDKMRVESRRLRKLLGK